MNREHTLFHLREAAEELETTIRDMSADSEYEYGELFVAMPPLYHHLNTAWNARDESPERVAAASDADFFRWRQFPPEIQLGE